MKIIGTLWAEWMYCLVLLALLAASWVLLNGELLDPSQNTFVYEDF
ncbi:MAG: hypothetical protein K2Q01_07540 [Rickettsiales bacterium]|nr:hypothetical protein [Rickettsiales bacterium]